MNNALFARLYAVEGRIKRVHALYHVFDRAFWRSGSLDF